MLYEFKKNYPEININQFLAKTSKYFQQYVSKGLEAVQAEKEGEVLRDGINGSYITLIALGIFLSQVTLSTLNTSVS